MEVLYDLDVGLTFQPRGDKSLERESLKCLDLLGQSKGAENAVITRAVNSLRLTFPRER